MKTCFLFPGQGAQYPGMGKDMWDAGEGVKKLFELASDITKIDMKRLLFEGTEEELKATENTQIAITLASLAAKIFLEERGITSDGSAGFSLGEYSALVDAGVLKLEDVFHVVQSRGIFMGEAGEALKNPAGNPGMAAVIGLTYDKITEILGKGDIEAYPANYNAPTQIVLAGTAEGLLAVESLCKEAGARRYIMLKVSGPFHSPLLESAREKFRGVVEQVSFSDPAKPVYANVTGKRISSGDEARKNVITQITSTVLWVNEEEQIKSDGYERIIEVGPGKVLTGLWKSITRDPACSPAGTVEQVEVLLS